MKEKHYIFLINNRLEAVLVFSEQNDELARQVKDEQGYEQYMWIGDEIPPVCWSTYDGTDFTLPTKEYLLSIGAILLITEENILPE